MRHVGYGVFDISVSFLSMSLQNPNYSAGSVSDVGSREYMLFIDYIVQEVAAACCSHRRPSSNARSCSRRCLAASSADPSREISGDSESRNAPNSSGSESRIAPTSSGARRRKDVFTCLNRWVADLNFSIRFLILLARPCKICPKTSVFFLDSFEVLYPYCCFSFTPVQLLIC